MSNLSTLARPYARAVFELARDAGRFEPWQKALETLAAIARMDEITALLRNPRVTTAQQADVFIDAAGDVLDQKAKRFVKVLAQYRRLEALPEIAEAFVALRAAAENTVKAELLTAVPATDAQRESIRQALVRRLGRNVELVSRVDESLIGGVEIRAGDLVIDSSLRGKLERLAGSVAA